MSRGSWSLARISTVGGDTWRFGGELAIGTAGSALIRAEVVRVAEPIGFGFARVNVRVWTAIREAVPTTRSAH